MKNTLANLKNVDAGYIFAKFLKGELVDGQGPVGLDLLHQQKMVLIDVASEEREASRKGDAEERKAHKDRAIALDGLIGFLDAFQDMLADDLKVWEYPDMEDEG